MRVFRHSLQLCMLLGFAAVLADETADLLDLSVEQLLQIPVTTATRTERELGTTPAAVFVITAEDLRRTGVRALPEALRLVPGFQVAQIESSKWAVSPRGFAGRFAYEMEILVDGRSVYSPLFSGTVWETLNIPIEEVERIEVIRGPGGSSWGPNAVNGVVNIITKPATRKTNTRLTLGAGSQERASCLVQQSGTLGETVAYRGYARGFERAEGDGRLGLEANDDWREQRLGLRLEWDVAEQDRLVFQGDYYRGTMGQTDLLPDPLAAAQWPGTIAVAGDLHTTGGYLMADWEHDLGGGASWSLRAYHQHEEREELSLDSLHRTYMLEFEHRFPAWNDRHQILWGGSYRLIRDLCRDTDIVQFTHDRQTLQTLSTFLQDEIQLMPERLSLTLGSRFEKTDQNGWQVQPSARLALTPTPKQTWWVAVSRAVRVPSRMEFTGRRSLVSGKTSIASTLFDYSAFFVGSESLRPETLTAYELGARFLPLDSLSLDLALYYQDTHHVVALVDGGQTIAPGTITQLYTASNGLDASCYGVEMAAKYRPTEWWRLDLTYTFMRVHMHPRGSAEHYSEDWFEEDAPKHQAGVLTSFRLSRNVDLHLWARYVDDIGDVAGYEVSPYITLDASIRWRITANTELTLAGRNLLESSHAEYYPSTLLPTASTEVPRSVYAQIAVEF